MGITTRKATFNIHPEVLAELDRVMTEGVAPSKNALVERALVKELKAMRKQLRAARWQEGAKDVALLHDICDIETAFVNADAETAGKMD